MTKNDLTSVSIKARKFVRYFVYLVIFYFVARFSINLLFNVYRTVFPKAPPPPTIGFSVLPEIPFPQREGALEIQYTLETATGEFPAFPKSMEVYLMPKATVKLSSLEEAKRIARAFGFNTDPLEITPVVYRFLHDTNPSSLEINIVNNVFSIDYNLSADPAPLSGPAPDSLTAVKTVVSFLSGGQVIGEDIDPENARVVYLKSSGGALINALAQSDAEVARVNIFRKPIVKGDKNYPSVTSDPQKANIWFLVGSSDRREFRVIAGEYHYFPINYESPETYPIKTAQQAYDDLVSGKGHIANLGAAAFGKVKIRKIYLGYYDPDNQGQFYQPVVIFEGDGGFMAYVPAVVDEYYGE